MRIGLIINPIAGIGGRVGLKGSDGLETQQKALALGAQTLSHLRAGVTLETLFPVKNLFELVTAAGLMGETAARQHGFKPTVIGPQSSGLTSAEDTRQAAREMLDDSIDLLLFAGGDGTARDIFTAVGTRVPVLGIPAGVKIHSAVFATHPRAAGEIAASFIHGKRLELRESEVIDLDEESYRAGTIITKLYGFLNVPILSHKVQNKKAPSPGREFAQMDAIAADVIESMQPGWLTILGPGTTTRAIADRLGVPKTLVGVDVYEGERVIALDAGEAKLLDLIADQPAKIVVSPVGGQGFIFGRGNQQISPNVLRKVGRENIILISLMEKLNALAGEPFLVDSGDAGLDGILAGYMPVISGYHEKVIYRVSA